MKVPVKEKIAAEREIEINSVLVFFVKLIIIIIYSSYLYKSILILSVELIEILHFILNSTLNNSTINW